MIAITPKANNSKDTIIELCYFKIKSLQNLLEIILKIFAISINIKLYH